MLCLKCGKKTEDGQIFCSHCLEIMDAYPVKPDIHIQLPSRPSAAAQKKQSRKRRALSTEEQVRFLRGKIRQLLTLMAVLLFALALTIVTLFITLTKSDGPEIGKNYTYVDSTE